MDRPAEQVEHPRFHARRRHVEQVLQISHRALRGAQPVQQPSHVQDCSLDLIVYPEKMKIVTKEHNKEAKRSRFQGRNKGEMV